LRALGHENADVIILDVSDRDTDILLATLNRLGGSDMLEKKLTLLKRLNQSAFKGRTSELAKLLPQTAGQIRRLTQFTVSDCKKAVENHKALTLNPKVFFLTDEQQAIIEEALSAASGKVERKKSRAEKNAASLTHIAQTYLNR
jgi:hypothetical protein